MYNPESIGFSKKPIISYLPPQHSLLNKHFKHHRINNQSSNQWSILFFLQSIYTEICFLLKINKKKYSLLVFVVLFLILIMAVGSLLAYRRNAYYQTSINQVIELQEQAKAFKQQGQIDLARQSLTTSLEQLEQLSAKSSKQPTAYFDLHSSLTHDLQDINQITLIENPNLFIDFSKILNTNQSLDISNLALVGKTLYVTDQANHKIYRLDLKHYLIAQADAPTDETSNISQIIDASPHGLLFSDYQQSIFTYQPQGSGFQIINSESISQELSKTTYIAYFNNNLYFLEPRNRQITKYAFSNNQISSSGQSWLTDQDVDLSDATSLAIDGNIYVTKQSGQILKLANGQSVEFNTQIHPGIRSTTQIFTSPEHKFIYILEPALYRLIVLDKTGQLLTQFNSPQFDNLKSFYPDEANNIIYLLNNNQIYTIQDYLPPQTSP